MSATEKLPGLKLQGIFAALTTPFNHQGALYKAKVFHNVEKLNSVALGGYLVGGSTGETPLLTFEERVQLMGWVKEASADGRTLLAGIGMESVQETILLADCAADLGYGAVLVLSPHYYRNQVFRPETQLLYFRAVADRSKLPVLLYNIPSVTGYHLPTEVVTELSLHPNIIGIKDSSGNLEALKNVVKAVQPDFRVLSGAGASFLDALQAGASGAILAIANAIPYSCVTIWEAFRTREHEAAKDWQSRISEAARLVNAVHGVPGLKHAMDLNGYYGGTPRLPFTPLKPEERSEIEAAFDGLRS